MSESIIRELKRNCKNCKCYKSCLGDGGNVPDDIKISGVAAKMCDDFKDIIFDE